MPDSEAARAAKTAIIQTLSKAKPGQAAVAVEELARHFAELSRVQERIRRMVQNYERRGTMVEKVFCDKCGRELGTRETRSWSTVGVSPRPTGDPEVVEADLCEPCARVVTVFEVQKEVHHA